MKYISFKWLITTLFILGIICISIGIINDFKPCQNIIYIPTSESDNLVGAETIYQDISKNVPYKIPPSSDNIDISQESEQSPIPYIIDETDEEEDEEDKVSEEDEADEANEEALSEKYYTYKNRWIKK